MKWKTLWTCSLSPWSSIQLWVCETSRQVSKEGIVGAQRKLTWLSLFTFMHWRRKWQPTPVFLPGESQGRRACWAAVYGVAQSRTWLKWLSSSSRENCPTCALMVHCLELKILKKQPTRGHSDPPSCLPGSRKSITQMKGILLASGGRKTPCCQK